MRLFHNANIPKYAATLAADSILALSSFQEINVVKFVVIADTHGQHAKLQLPGGDVLIHAGDISRRGRQGEVADFLQWFAQQPFRHKIFIAGNHDFYFERTLADDIALLIPAGVTYLNDSATVINGIHIWGSPVTPWFLSWAFNRHRGYDIQQHWNLIPANTDILITHGPVHGIHDRTVNGQHVGCEDLLHTVQLIKPKYFIGGHIHEAYGVVSKNGTTFINASVLDEEYRLVNNPVVFELS